jgi:hypothetical protein
MMRGVLTLLDELEGFGFDDRVFAKLHQFGKNGHINAFRSNAEKVGSFKPLGCNQLLQDRLALILEACRKGALKQGRTLDDLAYEAKRVIPRSRYSECERHATDDLESHR